MLRFPILKKYTYIQYYYYIFLFFHVYSNLFLLIYSSILGLSIIKQQKQLILKELSIFMIFYYFIFW